MHLCVGSMSFLDLQMMKMFRNSSLTYFQDHKYILYYCCKVNWLRWVLSTVEKKQQIHSLQHLCYYIIQNILTLPSCDDNGLCSHTSQ